MRSPCKTRQTLLHFQLRVWRSHPINTNSFVFLPPLFLFIDSVGIVCDYSSFKTRLETQLYVKHSVSCCLFSVRTWELFSISCNQSILFPWDKTRDKLVLLGYMLLSLFRVFYQINNGEKFVFGLHICRRQDTMSMVFTYPWNGLMLIERDAFSLLCVYAFQNNIHHSR
jgi:hypothetical protein